MIVNHICYYQIYEIVYVIYMSAIIADGVLLQIIGVLVIVSGLLFVFLPEKIRNHIRRCAKKTNEQYKIKGLNLLVLGAILFFLGVN